VREKGLPESWRRDSCVGDFFLNRKGLEGLGEFIPAVGVKIQGGPKKIENYTEALDKFGAHPNEDCGNAIGSLKPAGIEQR
jgi:hypothetical protein